jgi:hypothetical protein
VQVRNRGADGFGLEQSQQGSNPCRHLESVHRHLQQVRRRTVLAGQVVRLVQPVHSLGPHFIEGMDNRMDNGGVHLKKVTTSDPCLPRVVGST